MFDQSLLIQSCLVILARLGGYVARESCVYLARRLMAIQVDGLDVHTCTPIRFLSILTFSCSCDFLFL